MKYKNYIYAFAILVFEWLVMFSVLKISKNLVSDIETFQIQTIFMQIIAMMTVALVCLIVFQSYHKVFFVVREKKMLILLGTLYIVFFFLHKDFSIHGMYIFVQMLLIVAFSEEYVFRGIVYTLLKKENKVLAVIVTGVVWGMLHALHPAIANEVGFAEFMTMAMNQIGFGLIVGAGFIYVFEQSQTLLVPILLHALYNYAMGLGMVFYLGVILYYGYHQWKRNKRCRIQLS